MKPIRYKPLHVGLRSIIWIGERYQTDAGEEREYFCLTNDKDKLVEFTQIADFAPRNILFQYIEGEDTDYATYVSTVEEFDFIEMEQLWDIDELSIFGSYNSCDAAIIKAEYSTHQFYYWVRQGYTKKFLLQSDSDLYGPFSKNESILLNYIYRDKRLEFNLENYLLKKEEIRKYIDSLDINRFAENYDREKHIDTLMFDYIKEEIEYHNKYIFPKLLVWGE